MKRNLIANGDWITLCTDLIFYLLQVASYTFIDTVHTYFIHSLMKVNLGICICTLFSRAVDLHLKESHTRLVHKWMLNFRLQRFNSNFQSFTNVSGHKFTYFCYWYPLSSDNRYTKFVYKYYSFNKKAVIIVKWSFSIAPEYICKGACRATQPKFLPTCFLIW